MNALVEAIRVGDVMDGDKVRYNTNNHWPDNAPPANYKEYLSLTHASRWLSLFKSEDEIWTIRLERQDLSWLVKAFAAGIHTGQFPEGWREELEDSAEQIEASAEWRRFREANPSGGFVRLDEVSLKAGIHGTGPYKDAKSILESIATPRSCHSGLTGIKVDELGDQPIPIYLLPWRPDVDVKRELRVFVNSGRVTAASQQDLYRPSPFFPRLDREGRLPGLLRALVEFNRTEVQPKLEGIGLGSRVMDVSILPSKAETVALGEEGDEDWSFYFIEPNSWGLEYSSGSSLFGWLQDKALLYGDDPDCIAFRYTIDDAEGGDGSAA